MENLEPPFNDFYISWHENHPQAQPYKWRGVVWWNLGPYATGIDGDDKDKIRQQLMKKLKKEFGEKQ